MPHGMGRAMNDRLITVFGGGGFIGRYVVQALLQGGARVRVAERKPKQAWHLKAQAELGRFSTVAADVTHPGSLARAVQGADAVVNLVGSFDRMDAVQRRGAGAVAEAALEGGAKALIHVSAIGADLDSASHYGRSKGEGEAVVREAFPAATILRPSIVFGREDQFINRFAGLIRLLPVVPVIGANTHFQPVFVGDVAEAVATVVGNSDVHAGKIYELGGARTFSMLELNRWIAEAIGRDKLFLPVPDQVSALLARTTGWLPGAPITRDQWLMLQRDNVVGPDAAGLAALGITPTPLEAVASGWLVQYRRHGRFGLSAT